MEVDSHTVAIEVSRQVEMLLGERAELDDIEGLDDWTSEPSSSGTGSGSDITAAWPETRQSAQPRASSVPAHLPGMSTSLDASNEPNNG